MVQVVEVPCRHLLSSSVCWQGKAVCNVSHTHILARPHTQAADILIVKQILNGTNLQALADVLQLNDNDLHSDFRGAQAAVLVLDCTNPDSFTKVRSWVDGVKPLLVQHLKNCACTEICRSLN
jgi:hypothetical protein